MPTKPMSRTLKASIATGTAVLLLAGVGGTFARWFDEESVTSADINAGELSLTAPGEVTYSEASIGEIPAADIAAFNMVPGDVVTLTATVTPTLVGNNLEATLTADIGTAGGTLAEWVTTDVTVGGAADATLTEADSDTPIDVAIEITLPLETGGEPGVGNGTDAQNTVLDLEDLTLSLVQIDNP